MDVVCKQPPAWTRKRAIRILKTFEDMHPEAARQTALDYVSPYQLVVSVILSAQCTDKQVNRVTPVLFATWGDFNTLADASLKQVSEVIPSR